MSFIIGVLSGIIVGVLVGFAASYPVGYLRERGRQRAVRDEEAHATTLRRIAEKKSSAENARGRAEEETKRRDYIETLRKQRVGRRFVRRSNSRDEAGVIVTVIDLDAQQPERRVLVNNVPSQAAELPSYSPARLVMDWASLVRDPDEQRHRTARLVADSFDDADGWLEFEELPPGGG